MNREQLLEEVTQDILAYVMEGNFPEHELAKELKFDGLDERFEEYELLLDLHFILRDDVREYVEALPKRLRNIRTESHTVSRTHRGEIRGRINWESTVKERYSGNPRDRSLFVCEDHSTQYDIPENIVLKALLRVIHRTLQEAEAYLNKDYEWVQQTWKGNEELIEELQRVVERNVHVLRIREPKVTEPTDRMLFQAESARQVVYQEAAELYRERARLHRGDEDAIESLLRQKAITPDDLSTLFELYVLFKMVGTLERMLESTPVYRTIASDQQELVRIDSDREVVLYHDKSAEDRDHSFRSEVDDPASRSRSDEVQQESLELARTYFKNEQFRNHTGRPDVLILEVRDEEEPSYEYLITEVKYSSNTKTVRRGIKETLEYLAFLRLNEEFVFGTQTDSDLFGSGWNGLLVTRDLEDETQTLDEQIESDTSIKILQSGEIEDELEAILGQVIGEA